MLGGSYNGGEEQYAQSTGTPNGDDLDDLRGSICEFEQENNYSTVAMTEALNISITINNYKDSASVASLMDNLYSPQTAEGQQVVNKPVDVENVGEQAFFVKFNSDSNTADKSELLYVKTGRQVIALTATRLVGVDRDAVQTGLTKASQKNYSTILVLFNGLV